MALYSDDFLQLNKSKLQYFDAGQSWAPLYALISSDPSAIPYGDRVLVAFAIAKLRTVSSGAVMVYSEKFDYFPLFAAYYLSHKASLVFFLKQKPIQLILNSVTRSLASRIDNIVSSEFNQLTSFLVESDKDTKVVFIDCADIEKVKLLISNKKNFRLSLILLSAYADATESLGLFCTKSDASLIELADGSAIVMKNRSS